METVRRIAGVLLVGLVAGGAVACGDSGSAETAELTGPFPLPFGLEQLDGTEPIGRPAVYEEVAFRNEGVAYYADAVLAAYRVTADDPRAVLRAWAAQLGDGLTLDELQIQNGHGARAPWMSAYASGDFQEEGPHHDYADLSLWATDSAPILLVGISRLSDRPPHRPTTTDEASDGTDPALVVEETDRQAGDILFTEQGDDIHLPSGTRALMPTLPTAAGTGGSTSVLAADDGEAAVRALLREAMEIGENGEASTPEVTTAGGAQIVTAHFGIAAGGWGFEVVAIRAPDDPYATLYVSSNAD